MAGEGGQHQAAEHVAWIGGVRARVGEGAVRHPGIEQSRYLAIFDKKGEAGRTGSEVRLDSIRPESDRPKCRELRTVAGYPGEPTLAHLQGEQAQGASSRANARIRIN